MSKLAAYPLPQCREGIPTKNQLFKAFLLLHNYNKAFNYHGTSLLFHDGAECLGILYYEGVFKKSRLYTGMFDLHIKEGKKKSIVLGANPVKIVTGSDGLEAYWNPSVNDWILV